MKSKARVVSILVVLALLASVFGLLTVSAADGTVSLSKDFVTTPTTGGAVTVTLTDDDLNTGVTQTAEAVDSSGTAYAVSGLLPGSVASFFVQNRPLQDRASDSDTFLSREDVTVTTSTAGVLEVFALSANDGRVDIRNITTTAQTGSFTLTYVAADVQTTTVKVASTQDSTGFDLTLTETGADTGIFEATFDLAASTTSTNADDSTASTRPAIGGTAGDIVTVTYTDDDGTNRTDNVTIETTAPTVAVTSPADSASTQVITTRIEIVVTDSDAGVDADTIAVIITSTDALGVAVSPAVGSIIYGVAQAIAGGYTVTHQLTNVPSGETNIAYAVTASDLAGNEGVSDGRTLKIDTTAPAFASPIAAETGHNWDAALDPPAIVTDATLSDNTKIALYFNEDLDASTVDRTDFEIDIGGAKSTPAAADVYDTRLDVVFLTVPTLASDVLPVISVVAPISDKAGNPAATLAGVTASDGIGPAVTVSVTPTTNLHLDTLTIEITSDERLLTAPSVTVNGGSTGLTAVSSGGTNAFTTTFTSAATNAFNVVVVAKDTAGNEVTLGQAAHDTADAIVLEVDNALPAPTTLPIDADNTVAYSGSPLFIEIAYSDEAKEYGLDAVGGALSTTTGNIVVNLDTHAAVAITAVTLDGVDVSSDLVTEGAADYILALGALAQQTAAYEVIFTGEDDAGNTAVTTLSFTVEARPDFAIPLTTGWNLISLPGALVPGSSGINTVIPATHAIDIVSTYDPTSAQKWLVATRGADGTFDTDEISDIELGLAYWVHTTSFDALNVAIPGSRGGASSVLPTFKLVAGWNLVPVIDVSGSLVAGGAGITASTYLGNVTQSRIYEYDGRNDQFKVVLDTDALQVGSGYWVWVTGAGTIVP